MVPQPTWCIHFWTVPTHRLLPLIISGIVECPTGRQFGSKAAERGSGDSVPELQSGRFSRYPDPVQQPHYSATGTRPGDCIPPLLSVCSPFRLDGSCFSTHFNVFFFFLFSPQRDPILAKQLFSSLFAGILEEMEKGKVRESSRIKDELRLNLNTILSKSTLCFPPFVACVQV